MSATKNTPVPFVDLLPQYESLRAETDAAIRDVLETTAFINGPAVAVFEHAMARSIGSRHVLGMANCTVAIATVLRGLQVGPGDEVITTVHTAVCTTEPIVQLGARVVFCDIDPATYQIDAAQVEARITSRTKAIIAVHLYGIPVNLPAILDVAAKHGIPVIEDCAQAQGAEVAGRRVGSMGVAGCYSFFPSKNLGCAGDGGAIATSDDDLALFVRMYRNHGRLDKYDHLIAGSNERLDTLQAAILNVRLPHLDAWNARRRQIADLYAQLLSDVPAITLPKIYANTTPVWHLYVVRVPQRDAVAEYLANHGIGTGLHYPLPLHKQPSMRFGYREGEFPHAEMACSEILSLPMYPHLTDSQVHRVCDALRQHFDR